MAWLAFEDRLRIGRSLQAQGRVGCIQVIGSQDKGVVRVCWCLGGGPLLNTYDCDLVKRRKILKDRGQDNKLETPGLSPRSGFVPSEKKSGSKPRLICASFFSPTSVLF